MVQLSEKAIKEFKDLVEKKQGKEITWAEASESAHKLVHLFELLLKWDAEDRRRKKRLETEPKGFHMQGEGYTCPVCGDHISNEQTWYDKYGNKCLVCQKALDKKIIPGTVVSKSDTWYSKFDLESCFNISHHALRKFVKKGILKPRIIPGPNGGIHAQIFLIKDNKDMLPPKKLVKSHLVKETRDGHDWYHSEPWYRFGNPHVTLKGYKIMDHLEWVLVDKSKTDDVKS